MEPNSASEASANSTTDLFLTDKEKELNHLHQIRDLVVKFKEHFSDLLIGLDLWLERLTNSETDFVKGNQRPLLNALSFAVLVDYEVLDKFSNALIKNEHFKEALQLCKIVFAGYKGFFGSDHPKTLQAQLKLPSYLFTMKEYAQAFDLNREVYEILQRSNFGPNHELTMDVQRNVASIFMHQNKCAEAQQLLQDVHQKLIHSLGREHPKSVWSQTQLDSCSLQLKKEIKAKQMLEKLCGEAALREYSDMEALTAFEKIAEKIASILGPDHLKTHEAKYCAASHYFRLEQFKEAYKINRLIYEKKKKALGPSHVETLEIHLYMNMNLLRLDEYAEALRENKILHPLQEATLGADHEETLRSLLEIAECLKILNKHEESLDAYRLLLQKQQRIFGSIHEIPIETEHTIVGVLAKMGKCREALDALQKVYERQVELYGEGHAITALTKQFLDTGRRQLTLVEGGGALVCSICLATMEFLHPDSALLFECTHVFHSTCIYPWARDGRTCPECRRPLHAPAVDFLMSLRE